MYNKTIKGLILKPTLTLLIPCFNEAMRLLRSLEQLKAWIETNTDIPTRLIIVDDGSTDDTKKIIEDFKKRINLKVNHVWHEDNGFQKSQILNMYIVLEVHLCIL